MLTALLQQVILRKLNGRTCGCIFKKKNFLRDGLEKDYFQGHTLKMETNISQNLDYFLDAAYLQLNKKGESRGKAAA